MKNWVIRLCSLLALLILSISGRNYAHTVTVTYPDSTLSLAVVQPYLQLDTDDSQEALKFAASSGTQEYHEKGDTPDTETEDDSSSSAPKAIADRNYAVYYSNGPAAQQDNTAFRLPAGKHFLFAPAYRRHVILGVFRI
ncbi:hypothetical protein D3C72_736840 [compost metagenome]